MVLLIGFALVAGFLTCLSPCVLPVLPAVLAGGASGGRRRPLGVVTGMVVALTFSTIALVYVIAAFGLPDDLLRTLAIAVLFGFGVSLLVPPLSARIEAWLSRFSRAPRAATSHGFLSGIPLGLSLGLLYAPCAGPILAGVITVSAAQTFTASRLAVAFAYALGSAAALYLVMLGGRRVAAPLLARSGRLQQAMGALMIVIAMLVALQLDIRFQTAIASDLPGFLTTPAQKLQENRAVARALAGTQSRRALRPRGGREARYGLPLPVVGPAPEFVGTQRWFNTPGGARLTMRSLRGRVVLIDFWTYTCINCIRTFPHLRALDRKYRPNGLTIVGVHSPEFPFEKDAGNVAAAIRQNALTYPVAQDNDHATWDAYANQYYPADYLVDAQGRIRYVHFAEGDYETGERAVRALLAEAGRRRLGGLTRARVDLPSDELTTPESPLGAARGKGFINGRIHAGRRNYGRLPRHLPGNALAYAGRWSIGEAAATAEQHARLALDFTARRVFLVLGSPGRGRRLRVLLDGRPIPARAAGDDVRHGALRVRAQRLYRLVSLPRVEHHRLTVEPQAGISAYAFTFG